VSDQYKNKKPIDNPKYYYLISVKRWYTYFVLIALVLNTYYSFAEKIKLKKEKTGS